MALMVIPIAAEAGEVTANAELAYQVFQFNELSTSGFRQKYDLQLTQDIGTSTAIRIFARADDYSGSSGLDSGPQTGSRQIQPGAELTITGEKLALSLHGELQNTTAASGNRRSDQSTERMTARFQWKPDGLPIFNALATRFTTDAEALGVQRTDEDVSIRAEYAWRDLQFLARVGTTHSADLSEGYDLRQQIQAMDIGYAKTAFDDRFGINAVASARTSDIREMGSGDTGSSVPNPVVILTAANGIDDTPADNSDRPLVPNAALIDRDLRTSAGISLGPDGQSFNNIRLEFGRLEPLDEIRVIVRDELGNPVQIGGGAVQWDVWTSEDGEFWTQLPGATTSFNRALSYYSVRFDRVTKRWIKVVNFGVNVDETLVTEVEAYYFTSIEPGDERRYVRDEYLGVVNVFAMPSRGLTVSYSGSVNSIEQESTERDLAGVGDRSTTSIDHIVTARYRFRGPFSIRGTLSSLDSRESEGVDNSTSTWSGFVDWEPTDRLLVIGQFSQQDQSAEDQLYKLETLGISSTARILRSLSVVLNMGLQGEMPKTGVGSAKRTYVDLIANAQLTRAARVGVRASLSRVGRSEGYRPRFLGADRDDRVNADVRWSPARPLAVTGSVGWFQSETRRGTTGRLRVEWYPFGDGTLVIGGFADEDVDTATDRNATRGQLFARWAMNRFASVEINYTSVRTEMGSATEDESTLYATLRLTN